MAVRALLGECIPGKRRLVPFRNCWSGDEQDRKGAFRMLWKAMSEAAKEADFGEQGSPYTNALAEFKKGRGGNDKKRKKEDDGKLLQSITTLFLPGTAMEASIGTKGASRRWG